MPSPVPKALHMERRFDVIIVGHGAAGLAAAVSAAETGAGKHPRILVVERAPRDASGGNTRWSPSYMRLEAPDRLAPNFEADMMETSGNRSDPAYVARLAAEATPALRWLQDHGVTFDRPPNYFLTAAAPRIQPVGGGASVVRELTRAAVAAGVEFAYDTDAESIELDAAGAVAALVVNAAGTRERIATPAIVLACGGFEMDRAAMQQHLGDGAESIRPISSGTAYNTGAGVKMALAAGARTAGDWNGIHVEPVDPRSTKAEAVVLTYPYGIVVDRDGRRFFDEGSGRVDETWETLARTIHFHTPGRIAYAIFDASLYDIAGYERAICTDQEPVRGTTIEELGTALGIDAKALAHTVERYNANVPNDASDFDPSRVDGLESRAGLMPPKSNWARKIERPPFVAYPLVCAICYTFGGIETDAEARVIGANGPIPGLFAAGEITGQFYQKAPGGTSVLRALVYGKIAGRRALG
jgi:tricarballylate dehydrogenase